MGDIRVLRLDLADGVLPVERGGEDDVAFFLEDTDLVEPCWVECCILGGTAHRKNTRGWDGMYRNNAIPDVIIPSAIASNEEKMGDVRL
jgi:hypothetical protein